MSQWAFGQTDIIVWTMCDECRHRWHKGFFSVGLLPAKGGPSLGFTLAPLDDRPSLPLWLTAGVFVRR